MRLGLKTLATMSLFVSAKAFMPLGRVGSRAFSKGAMAMKNPSGKQPSTRD
jgi:hypothetical protein